MKEKTPAPPEKYVSGEFPAPEADGREDAPRIAGFAFIAVGILLMLLSGWAPTGSPAWENVSSEGLPPAGNPAIVSGGTGDDDLYGEPGSDIIVGGEGGDFIESKDGHRDYVICGPGDDVASVDEFDAVSSDCETVYRS